MQVFCFSLIKMSLLIIAKGEFCYEPRYDKMREGRKVEFKLGPSILKIKKKTTTTMMMMMMKMIMMIVLVHDTAQEKKLPFQLNHQRVTAL